MVTGALALAAMAMASPPASCADPIDAAALADLAGAPRRAVGTRDLLALRSFGPQDSNGESDPLFTVSPDGRQAALLLRRADPDTNDFCQSLVVVDLAHGTPHVVDRGGTMIRETVDFGGRFAGFPTGFPETITPAWSPDGRSIAYLKSMGGPAQVWLVGADGSGARQVTHLPQEATAVAWGRGAETILFRTDPGLTAAIAAIDREGLSGWHYDDRSMPTNRAMPFPAPSDPLTRDYALDLASGAIRPASPAERVLLADAGTASRNRVQHGDGIVAMLDARGASSNPYVFGQQLRATIGGRAYVCAAAPCAVGRASWLSDDGRSVLLLARSGWGNGDETFYRWQPLTGRVRRLATTRDVLLGCRPVGKRMLCAREAATTPRRLALIDPATGATGPVFDPNPDYGLLRTGSVERLPVSAANGDQAFADLMLPPDYVAGRRYPMVVVQYESRGFLGGGTNNEFPIAPFASAGMAVLSFQRPRDILYAAAKPPTTFSEAMKSNLDGWADRRNVHSALMAAVDRAIARGVADPARIGITGLSDGLGTAAFALLNSDRFSAVALAGCCEEPIEGLVYQGPRFAHDIVAAGYPPYGAPSEAYWKNYSIAQNAARVRAPILIQAPDKEYLLSLPTFAALRAAGVPTDLYVFPDEDHSKWQPAHRLAVWERTLRWFEFWFGLPRMAGQAAAPADEIVRWQAWRATWHPPTARQP